MSSDVEPGRTALRDPEALEAALGAAESDAASLAGWLLERRAPAGAEAEPAPGWRRTTSEALMRGARKLRILHAGEAYTLQVTRQNKLLLTK